MVQSGGVSFSRDRLGTAQLSAFLIAAVVALALWACGEKWAQDAWPALKEQKRLFKAMNPLALYLVPNFILLAMVLAAISKRDSGLDAPGRIERTFAVNLPAKIAAVPMVLTATVIFFGATIWTIVHSFTGSKLLPKLNFVGTAQYERLWDSNRWLVSIENLAIYGICSLIFSLVIGFILAALLDQKIRFENTFRTIFLYPFALSFIVTGLVWQWLLNPEFGIQSIVRSMGLGRLHLRPALQSGDRHLRHPDRRSLAGHRADHVPHARRPAAASTKTSGKPPAWTASPHGRPISSSSSR